MDNNSPQNTNNTQDTTALSGRQLEKTVRNCMILTAICTILAVVGTGFGIYGTVQANRALNYLDENGFNTTGNDNDGETIADDNLENEDYTAEDEYGKPTRAESIQTISISYNNNTDYVDIYNDNTIEYYAYNDDDEYIGDLIETDTTEIIKYIFENDLEYVGDNEYLDDETWSISIISKDGYSYASGESDAPAWFQEILNRLNVDQNGYRSRNAN